MGVISPVSTWVIDVDAVRAAMDAAGFGGSSGVSRLARAAELSESTVRGLVTGRTASPSVNAVVKVTDVLGVEVKDVLLKVGPDGVPHDSRITPRIDRDSLVYAAKRAGFLALGLDDVYGLAHKAGVAEKAVRNIVSGRVERPRAETVRRLSRALGVEPCDILVVG